MNTTETQPANADAFQPEAYIKEVTQLLLNGHLDKVLELTAGSESKSGLQKRVMLHLSGLAHVYAGALNKAKLVFLKALDEEGENVALVRDLACVYYQLGEIDHWRSTYSRLSRLLAEHQHLLNPETHISTRLVLAKFLEEEGQVAKALDNYENCYREAMLNKRRSELHLQCLAQVIRLKALFRNGANLGALYAELISLRPQSITKDLQFEVQHALMLAEMSLVGPEHAWERVRTSLVDPSVAAADKRLIFFDFVEESLVSTGSLPEGASKLVPDMNGADVFEEEVHRVAFSEQGQRPLLMLSHLAAELSWACYLRLLILYLSLEKRTDKAEELKNKINLILGALDPDSRPFWLNRMKPYLGVADLMIQFSPQQRLVAFQNKKLDLSRKRGMLVLLEALAEHQSLSVESMIERVWGSSYSPEYYHRLRMTVHRLNQLLFDLTAIPKIIEINSESVAIKPSVTLAATNIQS